MQTLPRDCLSVVGEFLPRKGERDGVHRLWHVWRQAAPLRLPILQKEIQRWADRIRSRVSPHVFKYRDTFRNAMDRDWRSLNFCAKLARKHAHCNTYRLLEGLKAHDERLRDSYACWLEYDNSILGLYLLSYSYPDRSSTWKFNERLLDREPEEAVARLLR